MHVQNCAIEFWRVCVCAPTPFRLTTLPDLVPSRVRLKSEKYLVQNLVKLSVSVKLKSGNM